MIYGYARVSTDGQTLDAQVAQLREAGAKEVFKEKVSGAKTVRAELRRAIARLAAGDVLIVTKLDRFARSTVDTLNLLDEVTAKGAGFRSLGEAWADTTTPAGRMFVTFIAGFAEYERTLIRQRTGEGIADARRRGVKFGPKFKLTPHQQREAQQRRAAGEMVTAIARTFNVSHSTISRLPDVPAAREIPARPKVAAKVRKLTDAAKAA